METLRRIFEKLKGVDKKRLAKFIAIVIVIAFLSFLIEHFGFGGFKGVDNEIRTFEDSRIERDGFGLTSSGEFFSEGSGILILDNQGRFIRNLKLELGEDPEYDISASYVNSNGEQVLLEKNLKSTIKKNIGENFLQFLVFNINDSPDKITISSSEEDTIISDIIIDNEYQFNWYRFVFIFGTGLLIASLVIFRKKVGKSPEYGFLVVSLVCGFLISFSAPLSFVSWDEFIHYKRVDNGAFKHIIGKDVKDPFSRANSVPSSYSIEEQNAINEFVQSRVKDDNKSKNRDYSLLETYNRIGYFPSSVGLMIGRVLNFPNHWVFILGKLMSLAAYSTVVFFAIRRLKTGKMLVSLIALFPTSLFLASSYGYDAWVTAFTMLGLAYLFSELQQPEKKIKLREAFIMIGSLFLGIGPKAIYFPLLFLLLFLKPSKFESKGLYRKYMGSVVLTIILVVASFLVPFLVGGPGDGDSRGGSAVNATEQVHFIFSEPLVYSKILIKFILDYISLENAAGYVVSFAYLGGVGGFIILMVLLGIVTFTDRKFIDELTTTSKIRLWVSILTFSTIVLISTALYIDFTAVRSETVAGVQPRYLLPLLFPFLYVFGSSKIINNVKRSVYNLIILSIVSFVLLQGIWEVLVSKYY